MNSTLLRNVFSSRKARAISLACVTAIGMFSLPAIASADGRYHDRGDDRRDDRRDNRGDNRNDDRNRSRDSRTDVHVGIRIGEPAPRYEERTTRVWVEPVYRTLCERVWVEPVYRTECERVWVPDRFEVRETREGYGRNVRIVRREMLIEAGHYENVERQVIAQYGHWENVERQELISPGHFEYRTERVAVNDRPGSVFDIILSRR